MAKLPLFIRSSDVLRRMADMEDRITKLERQRAADATVRSLEALVAAVKEVAAATLKNALDQEALAKMAKLLDANTAGILEAQRDDTGKFKFSERR